MEQMVFRISIQWFILHHWIGTQILLEDMINTPSGFRENPTDFLYHLYLDHPRSKFGEAPKVAVVRCPEASNGGSGPKIHSLAGQEGAGQECNAFCRFPSHPLELSAFSGSRTGLPNVEVLPGRGTASPVGDGGRPWRTQTRPAEMVRVLVGPPEPELK